MLNSLGPSRRVSFTSPSWTQRNSLHARSEAAETFSEFLKVDLEAHRDARHFIVAHSHGGNIAVSALKLLSVEERRRVSGLVTMGTPFLWFECLEVGVVAQVVLFLARLLVPTYIAIGVLAAAFLVGLLPLVEFQLLPGWLNTWPFYVFALVIGLWMVTDDYNKTEETYRLALTSKALQRDDTIPPMLVLRSPDDEASRGMRSGQTTARLLMVVWTLFDTLFTRGKTWWKAALVVVAAPVVGAIQEAGWREASVAAVITALRNPVDVFFQGLMLLYIGGTLGAIAFSTLASVPLAITLGPELLRLPLLVKPVVEDMPTSIRVRAMNLPGSGFRHKVYAHPEAPEQVAAFVSEIAG